MICGAEQKWTESVETRDQYVYIIQALNISVAFNFSLGEREMGTWLGQSVKAQLQRVFGGKKELAQHTERSRQPLIVV